MSETNALISAGVGNPLGGWLYVSITSSKNVFRRSLTLRVDSNGRPGRQKVILIPAGAAAAAAAGPLGFA